MMNPASPPPARSDLFRNAALLGCLGVITLSLMILAVASVLLLLRGPASPLNPTATGAPASPSPTETALSSFTPTETSTPAPTSTATSTSTPLFTFTPYATFTFTPSPTHTATRTSTVTPTRTRTPTPTKTFTPTATRPPSPIGDAHYGFTYNNWWGMSSDRAFGDGMRCSAQKNGTVIYNITQRTTEFGVVLHRGPNQGKANLYIDGALMDTLDLYNPKPQFGIENTYSGLSPNVSHEVKLVVLREKRPAATDFRVCLDSFRVKRQRIDDKSYEIQYGFWRSGQNPNAHGDFYRISGAPNAAISFQINGRTFTWVTAKGPAYGQADVYVDDTLIQTIDLYAPTQKWQVQLQFKGLGLGKHTVRIVVLGQHNSASAGNGVVFDGALLPQTDIPVLPSSLEPHAAQ